jgi:hypothetical protein
MDEMPSSNLRPIQEENVSIPFVVVSFSCCFLVVFMVCFGCLVFVLCVARTGSHLHQQDDDNSVWDTTTVGSYRQTIMFSATMPLKVTIHSFTLLVMIMFYPNKPTNFNLLT